MHNEFRVPYMVWQVCVMNKKFRGTKKLSSTATTHTWSQGAQLKVSGEPTLHDQGQQVLIPAQ